MDLTRLASFVSWESGTSAVLLASAGFSCVDNKATCQICHVVLGDDELNNQEFRKFHRIGCKFCVLPLPQEQPHDPNLTTTEGRLSTFVNWPSVVVKPEDLAECGFFYTGATDRVRCAFCKGSLHNWCKDDSPFNEHRRHFPQCPFVKRRQEEEETAKNETVKKNLTEDETMQSLIEDNTRLKEARQCKVCMDKTVDTVFLPCGHLITCNGCAERVKNCPMCRMLIRGTVRTFLS